MFADIPPEYEELLSSVPSGLHKSETLGRYNLVSVNSPILRDERLRKQIPDIREALQAALDGNFSPLISRGHMLFRAHIDPEIALNIYGLSVKRGVPLAIVNHGPSFSAAEKKINS